jgi:hypothetical protein
VGVAVGVGEGVKVGVAVGVEVGVGVAIGVDVGVAVGVNVGVGVEVGVAVGVGVGVGPANDAENSDVSIGLSDSSSLVAVAVTNTWLGGTGNESGPKLALQFPSVVTFVEPRKVCPSPKPDGSPSALEKNSRRNVVFETLSNVPESTTSPFEKEADVITG